MAQAEKGKVGYGWELKDDEEGVCVISKLIKLPDGGKVIFLHTHGSVFARIFAY